MCGIVGIVGKHPVGSFIIDGLKRMEYRGYDSAGTVVLSHGDFRLFRSVGHVINLEKVVDFQEDDFIGIGHTRWATHGKVNIKNTHPHLSYDGEFAIVHNGVVENYLELKHELMQRGIPFQSDTDTEVIVNYLAYLYQEETRDVTRAIELLQQRLLGIYSFVVLHRKEEDTLYAVRNRAPLLIGLGKEFIAVASDMLAMANETSYFVSLDDQEIAVLHHSSYQVFKQGEEVLKTPFTMHIPESSMDKGNYEHYMLKEIHEQPFVLRKIISKYTSDEGVTIDPVIVNTMRQADSIQIVACGTSYHAGLVGKVILERMVGKKVEVHVASEFSYNYPMTSEHPVFLLISQSGETADLRLTLDKIKERNHPVYTITNVYGSTLAREADQYLLLYAGPEIAVASTKAYTAQIAMLALLAQALNPDVNLVYELSKIAFVMEETFDLEQQIKEMVKSTLANSRTCFYIGRGIDYYLCLEAALKLKEISYIQAEGFASGELKHGTIALIENDTPVIAIITQLNTALATRSNIEEVRSRGAKTVIICSESFMKPGDDFILKDVHPLLTPLISAVLVQMIAYHAAVIKGTNVDKPRNLAKSVTVE